MSKIFYMELFRAMAQHITESHEFQLWAMENNIRWERDCYLDRGNVKKDGELLTDWEMAEMYLTAIGDLKLSGHKAKSRP